MTQAQQRSLEKIRAEFEGDKDACVLDVSTDTMADRFSWSISEIAGEAYFDGYEYDEDQMIVRKIAGKIGKRGAVKIF